jgi:long-chain acyl-CoA synthetase
MRMTSTDVNRMEEPARRAGLAAEAGQTVASLFFRRVAATPNKPAYRSPDGDRWVSLTWAEMDAKVRDIAAGLRQLGLQMGERCAIVSPTRLEWIAADFGIVCAGGVTTTIYPTNTAAECAWVLSDSQSRFAFAEDAKQIAKLLERREELVGLERVIAFDGSASDDGWVMPVSALEALGRERRTREPDEIDRIARELTPDGLATLIYTSGTTGTPKGVECTHANWAYAASAVEAVNVVRSDDVNLLWLPLAHSFAKVIEIVQLSVGFESAVDGRQEKLVDNFAAVRPTFVAAVPRVFEKVFNKVVAGAKEGGAARFAVFKWAMKVGREVSALRQRGEEPRGTLAARHRIADRLVFTKLRERFGGRLRFFVSGAAPLSREIAEFFHAADILVLEGYGLTETNSASFINRPDGYRFGTVGRPFPGTEVKIAEEDGEILIRSPGVMRGYHGHPEATAEAIDEEGWLHTGDVGVLQDGFLRITDRKKDMIKTAGGKYVAPQAVENRFKAHCPFVSQVHVHGNNRPYCVALVALDEAAIKAWAEEAGLGALGYGELTAHPRVRGLIQGYVDEANAGLNSFEQIKKFAILPAELTVESGDLTPTQKIKRKVVEAKNASLLDSLYQGTVARELG